MSTFRQLHRLTASGVTLLLAYATVLAALSFLFHMVVPGNSLFGEVALAYVPVLLGCVSMWLCFKAWKGAAHKRFVIFYAIVLAPFAFSYPAWLLILWILYAAGLYHGPMP